MRALITGAGGFLGTHTVRRVLARTPEELRLLCRSRPVPLEELRARYPQTSIRTEKGNLLSSTDMERALDSVDTVFHLAAELKGAPAEMFLNTVVGSKRLLEACSHVRRIVLVSSFGVYGTAHLRRGAMVDELTPLDKQPERRDAYSFVKLHQELLFREYQQKLGYELIVLRPGVIYGPGNASLSTRIGVNFPGFFLHVGGSNLMPLTYVENCAEAIAVAGSQFAVDTVNVVDDDLITCREYLGRYKRTVGGYRSVPFPYSAAIGLSGAVEWYNRKSRGQLPAILTPYKAAVLWKGNRFRNDRLKSIGWKQLIPTCAALGKTFDWIARDKRTTVDD